MTDNSGWQLQFSHTVEFSLPSPNGLKGYIVQVWKANYKFKYMNRA